MMKRVWVVLLVLTIFISACDDDEIQPYPTATPAQVDKYVEGAQCYNSYCDEGYIPNPIPQCRRCDDNEINACTGNNEGCPGCTPSPYRWIYVSADDEAAYSTSYNNGEFLYKYFLDGPSPGSCIENTEFRHACYCDGYFKCVPCTPANGNQQQPTATPENVMEAYPPEEEVTPQATVLAASELATGHGSKAMLYGVASHNYDASYYTGGNIYDSELNVIGGYDPGTIIDVEGYKNINGLDYAFTPEGEYYKVSYRGPEGNEIYLSPLLVSSQSTLTGYTKDGYSVPYSVLDYYSMVFNTVIEIGSDVRNFQFIEDEWNGCLYTDYCDGLGDVYPSCRSNIIEAVQCISSVINSPDTATRYKIGARCDVVDQQAKECIKRESGSSTIQCVETCKQFHRKNLEDQAFLVNRIVLNRVIEGGYYPNNIYQVLTQGAGKIGPQFSYTKQGYWARGYIINPEETDMRRVLEGIPPVARGAHSFVNETYNSALWKACSEGTFKALTWTGDNYEINGHFAGRTALVPTYLTQRVIDKLTNYQNPTASDSLNVYNPYTGANPQLKYVISAFSTAYVATDYSPAAEFYQPLLQEFNIPPPADGDYESVAKQIYDYFNS